MDGEAASSMSRSAYKARGDSREYNVYVETSTVEEAWPKLPDWPLSPQIGPLLASFEIALKILDDTLDDAGARAYLNDAAKAEVVAASVGSLLSLIADLAFDKPGCPPPEKVMMGAGTAVSRTSAWHGVMAKLEQVDNGARIKAELHSRCDLAARALGFELGLRAAPDQRRFDYDKWVRPAAMHGLYAPDRRGRYVEDPIFVRVHQVCEGILEAMLVELDLVEAALFKADYGAAEQRALMASRFMAPFKHAISLLGEMCQFDYAPLRVALRDASGIQSARAQARKQTVQDLFWLFRQQLRNRGLDCFVLFANPGEHIAEHRLLQAFKTLAKSIDESMSHHAHLVQNTLGSTVIGTVGFRIMSLGEMAAQPLLRELAGALDWLTLFTSLCFADHSGRVIHEQELRHGAADKYGREPPTEACDPALMKAAVEKYFDAIRRHAKSEWKELFCEHPHFEDPRGTKPYVSEWNLDVFFRNFQKLFPKMLGAEHAIVEQGGNHLEVAWNMEAESFLNKMVVRFSGRETFWFDSRGRIATAVAHWQPAALAGEMMDRHRAALRESAARAGRR